MCARFEFSFVWYGFCREIVLVLGVSTRRKRGKRMANGERRGVMFYLNVSPVVLSSLCELFHLNVSIVVKEYYGREFCHYSVSLVGERKGE